MNGIHPGNYLWGNGANDQRFDLLINDLMPVEDCRNKVITSNYDWRNDSKKHTLKEFEKQVYYFNGDYQKAYT